VEAGLRRIAAAETLLADEAPSAALFCEAGAIAAAEVQPLEDAQADAGYRRELAQAMVFRALARACLSARSGRVRRPVDITLGVNGRDHRLRLEPRRTLLDALRDECGRTGTHMGCEHGVCSARTALVDGAPIRACLICAVQADGGEIGTVEGPAVGGDLTPLQETFSKHHSVQCRPGFLMLATAILERDPDIADEDLLEALSSNLCRCTGYANIVAAVRAALAAAEARR